MRLIMQHRQKWWLAQAWPSKPSPQWALVSMLSTAALPVPNVLMTLHASERSPMGNSGGAAQLRVAREAWSRECPMLSVALRTRVEAQLLPAAGPAPQPQQHRGCSPMLGLKHSIEWALPPPAAGGHPFPWYKELLCSTKRCRVALHLSFIQHHCLVAVMPGA